MTTYARKVLDVAVHNLDRSIEVQEASIKELRNDLGIAENDLQNSYNHRVELINSIIALDALKRDAV
jgi:hypothetical protein